MKANRSELKDLLKEILIEILKEGIDGLPTVQRRQSSVTEQTHTNGRRKPAYDPRLDAPLTKGRQPTDALKEAIRQNASSPLMADILADTALTTLPSQLDGEPPTYGGSSGPVMSEQVTGQLDEVFGSGGSQRSDGSSHWADLAFMSAKKST